jgi:AcrR family transcriptional regulator
MQNTNPLSPWHNPKTREELREEKRLAVLHTAAALFNEKGFHATSLDEVAERLDISKPTVYYYVKNKEEILFECVRIGLEMVVGAANEATRAGGTAQEKLAAVMRKYAEIVTMDFGTCLIRVGEDPLPPASRATLRKLKAKIDRQFRTLVQEGIDEGVFAPCDPKTTAFGIAGMLSWIAIWYDPQGPMSAREIADNYIRLIINGLAAKPPAARERGKPASRRR